MPRKHTTLTTLVLAVSLVLGTSFATAATTGTANAQEAPKGPNILFVMADDLDRTTMEQDKVLTRTKALVRDQGVTFDRAGYVDPLCCPSRASIQRGQFAHNHGVITNLPPHGGFGQFVEKENQLQTVGTVLDDAGYTTGYFGKYMNGYGTWGGGKHYKVPGWDTWRAAIGGPGKNTFSIDGKPKTFKKGFADSNTATMADNFMRTEREEPFFAMVSFANPHKDAPFPKSYEKMYRHERLATLDDPSYNEADLSDKPPFLSGNPDRVTNKERVAMTQFQRDRLRGIEYVDRQIARIVGSLERNGELDNTVIVFWSDNGYHLGQHTLPRHNFGGKEYPYLTDVNVPMWVRGPGVEPATTSDALVQNIDLLPTFAELGHTSSLDFVDGSSFWDVATGQTSYQRTYAFAEGWPQEAPSWVSVSTRDETYHQWTGGFEELYDLESDPYQLENLLAPEAALISSAASPETADNADVLAERAELMRNCAAEACRLASAE